MEKRDNISRDRDRVETGDKVQEIPSVVNFDLPLPAVQRVVLLKDLTVKIKGPASGKLYVFQGAGSIVDVDIIDVEGLLEKKNPTSCCGVGGPTPYFSLVDDGG